MQESSCVPSNQSLKRETECKAFERPHLAGAETGLGLRSDSSRIRRVIVSPTQTSGGRLFGKQAQSRPLTSLALGGWGPDPDKEQSLGLAGDDQGGWQ